MIHENLIWINSMHVVKFSVFLYVRAIIMFVFITSELIRLHTLRILQAISHSLTPT